MFKLIFYPELTTIGQNGHEILKFSLDFRRNLICKLTCLLQDLLKNLIYLCHGDLIQKLLRLMLFL